MSQSTGGGRRDPHKRSGRLCSLRPRPAGGRRRARSLGGACRRRCIRRARRGRGRSRCWDGACRRPAGDSERRARRWRADNRRCATQRFHSLLHCCLSITSKWCGALVRQALRFGRPLCPILPSPSAAVMLASGIVQTAVSLLARLGPPTGPRGSRPAPSGPGPWVEEEFNARQASPSSSAARGAGVGPIAGGGAAEASSGAAPAELYFGFRRDLVAVVGNLCHARPAAVDALMRADGVAIILQQCRGDEGARPHRLTVHAPRLMHVLPHRPW